MSALRRFRNVVWLLFALSATRCGEDVVPAAVVAPQPVSGLSAAYVPELKAVRVGWLPAAVADISGYEVSRIGPLDIATDVSGVTSGGVAVGRVTATTWDDVAIESNRIYGYSVALSFPNGTTAAPSAPVWITLSSSATGIPIPAGTSTGLCAAVTEAAILDRIQVAPVDPDRAAMPVSDSPAVRLEAMLSVSVETSLHWIERRVDGENVTIGSAWNLSWHPRCVPSTTYSFSDSAPAGYTPSGDAYAIAAELRVGDLRHRVVFPLDSAGERIRISAVEPQPGLTLRAGYQEFRGTVDYALINPAGRQLTVWVLAVDTGHNARVLDAQQFAAQTTGSETVALAAQVPPNTLFVRLLARIGAATLDSSHLEDEVFYAVVP